MLDRLAENVPAESLATALAGAGASGEVAIAFVRSCLRPGAPTDLPDYLTPDELGVQAPWLPPVLLRHCLEQVIDDVVHRRFRNGRGEVVDLPDESEAVVDLLTLQELRQIAHRLPSSLATRASGVLLDRLRNDPTDQELALTAVTLAPRLPPQDREVMLGLVVEHLDDLLTHGGRMDWVEEIADGLGRAGRAADLFAAAGRSGGTGGDWHDALVGAAPHLPEPAVADALSIASNLHDLYRPWVLTTVLARLGASPASRVPNLSGQNI